MEREKKTMKFNIKIRIQRQEISRNMFVGIILLAVVTEKKINMKVSNIDMGALMQQDQIYEAVQTRKQ